MATQTLFYILLAIHIAAGTVNLLTGIMVIVLRKGGRTHKRLGKVFFYAMLVVAASATAMALIHPNSFLLSIGLFSAYLAYTGYIHVLPRYYRLRWTVWPAALLGAGTGIFMVTSGSIVLIVFGSIQLIQVVMDVMAMLKKQLPAKSILGAHIGKMMGAFTATCTAFLIVAAQQGEWYMWLLPTVVITPLSIYWQVRNGRRKRPVMQEEAA